MASSLAVAAPPIVALLLLLWRLDRHAGRSGAVLLGSVLWGGIVATGLVTLTGSLVFEQPSFYPYLVTPAVEELAKAALFLVLVPLGLVSSAARGMACGLACGLGFALWENAAYFDRYGQGGPPLLLYVTRTAGATLLHAVSTGAFGAAAGVGGRRTGLARRAALLAVAGTAAVLVHSAWNYVCLVLADTSALRRLLPATGAALLLLLLVYWVLRERTLLQVEVLGLWRDGVLAEPLAKAATSRRPVRGLAAAGVAAPRRLLDAVMRLAVARRLLADTPARGRRSRRRTERQVLELTAVVEALAAGRRPGPSRRLGSRVALGAAFVGAAVLLHGLGDRSPVPAALARRTVVVTSGERSRADPLIVVAESGAYLLWQRDKGAAREQVLSWIGPGRRLHTPIGLLPEGRSTWFEMTGLGPGVLVATRDDHAVHLRSFLEGEQVDEALLEAPEVQPGLPCWPWLTSDQGRTLLAWDRLRRAAWIGFEPLRAGPTLELPDPFDGVDEGEQGCFRGLMLTDRTAYEVARTEGRSLLAAVDLETGLGTRLEVCPGRPRLRLHSLDKDSGEVLVLLGAPEPDGSGYDLLLARLDRAGQVLEPCRHLRTMPAGEPAVVSLAGAGESAFVAWATDSHVLLARLPLGPTRGGRERRWVLDRAPRGGPGVVRLGVVDRRLYVAWEAPSAGGRHALKLLRTEIDDLP